MFKKGKAGSAVCVCMRVQRRSKRQKAEEGNMDTQTDTQCLALTISTGTNYIGIDQGERGGRKKTKKPYMQIRFATA